MVAPAPPSAPVAEAPTVPHAAPAEASAPRRGALGRTWHVLRLGIAFGTFGLASLTLGALVAPVIGLMPLAKPRKERLVQRFVRGFFASFLAFSELLRLIRVRTAPEVGRLEGGPYLVVSNHPTLLDVVIIIARLPHADCVVKRAIWESFWMGGVARAAGYIPNDEGLALVETCAARLQAGRNVMLFPEGTRSPRGGLGPFRRGFAHIALAGGRRLLPLVMTCEPPALMKGQPWHETPPGLTFHLRALTPLDPATLAEGGDSEPALARGAASPVPSAAAREADPLSREDSSGPPGDEDASDAGGGAERAKAARRLARALRTIYERELFHGR